MTAATRKIPGTIESGTAYTVREFQQRCRLGEFAFRKVKSLGLRVVTVCERKQFVLGADWIRFLEQQPSA